MEKNVISESFDEYSFNGRFPNSVFFKLKFYFQYGIQEWWQKHLNWSLIMNGNFKLAVMENTAANTVPETYSLCIIPLVGVLLSVCVFVFFESCFCSLILLKVKQIWWDITQIVFGLRKQNLVLIFVVENN